jgi:hypothetical protein
MARLGGLSTKNAPRPVNAPVGKQSMKLTAEDKSLLLDFVPVVGDIKGAYETVDMIASELEKDDPNYALIGILGGVGAAATIIGLVPGIGDVAQKAIMAGARSVADSASNVGRGALDFAQRIEVDPNALGALGGNVRLKPASKANKADLDPLGYQNTRMNDAYLADTDVRFTDLNENLPRQPMSWEETEGKVILPLYGDRTSGGLLIEGVNDVNFDTPVYTEAGVDFMRGRAAQTDDAIWASNQNIIDRIDKESTKAAKEFDGADILGVTGSMAPDANDFATMTGGAMAELIKGAKITKKSAKEFDEIMKAIDPDFVGVLSPKIREWAATTTSPKRKAFIRLMDSAPMQAKGFPSPALARYSVTDPTQRDMPAGMFGLGAAKIDTEAPLMFNTPKGNLPKTNVPHSTYNTQIKGEYFGSLPPVPQGLVFRDVYDAMEGKFTKSGQPLNEAHKTHAIKTKMPAQKITPEILEGILDYRARLER